MNWWKKKGQDYDAIEDSLNTVPSMMRNKMVTDTLSDWHSDLGFSKTEFKNLSAKEAQKAGNDLHESMLWWDREGKNLNVDQDVQDAEEFKKAKCLAQLWQKTNMPRKHKEQASKEIKNLLQWMRKKNKNFDLDAVQSEKAE